MVALSEWVGSLIRKWRSASVQPSLFPAPSDEPMPEAIKEASERAVSPVSPTELVPGCRFSFISILAHFLAEIYL